ncbi:hypothetical protein F5I97DRAFT_245695 [Phlebopus sp. FC_14]|nr:hypothetical protein F5I97DRAFT_245695 [Phlebopus sp. FC_14]
MKGVTALLEHVYGLFLSSSAHSLSFMMARSISGQPSRRCQETRVQSTFQRHSTKRLARKHRPSTSSPSLTGVRRRQRITPSVVTKGSTSAFATTHLTKHTKEIMTGRFASQHADYVDPRSLVWHFPAFSLYELSSSGFYYRYRLAINHTFTVGAASTAFGYFDILPSPLSFLSTAYLTFTYRILAVDHLFLTTFSEFVSRRGPSQATLTTLTSLLATEKSEESAREK